MGEKGEKHTQGLVATRGVDLSSGLKVSELKGKLKKLGLSFLLKAPEDILRERLASFLAFLDAKGN